MQIFFSNIPPDTKPYELFLYIVPSLDKENSSPNPVGSEIKKINILIQRDKNNQTVCHHGLVEIDNIKAAKLSISRLNNTRFKDRNMTIREFINRTPENDRRTQAPGKVSFIKNRRKTARRKHTLEIVSNLGF